MTALGGGPPPLSESEVVRALRSYREACIRIGRCRTLEQWGGEMAAAKEQNAAEKILLDALRLAYPDSAEVERLSSREAALRALAQKVSQAATTYFAGYDNPNCQTKELQQLRWAFEAELSRLLDEGKE